MSVPVDALGVFLLLPTASVPVRATAGSVGYDLAAAEAVTVPAHGQALVRTGLSLTLPDGCYGRIAPRSGLAVRHSLHVGAGVIDQDYTGEVKVVLFNLGASDVTFAVGDRVAQLVLECCKVVNAVILGRADHATRAEDDAAVAAERGEAGFGSTGVGSRAL
jgi:dUTP pyrophosphatase